MLTGKEEPARLIQGQPHDNSGEGIVNELAFYAMVACGLADSDAEYCISNDEMGRRFRSSQQ